MTDKIKEKWSALDAKKRQLIFVGSIVMFAFTCMFFVMDNTTAQEVDPNAKKVRAARDVVTQSFTGANTRDMDMHGMAAQIKEMERSMRTLGTQFDEMNRRLEGRDRAQREAVNRSVQEAKNHLAKQTMDLLEDKYGTNFANVEDLNIRLEQTLEEAALAAEKALAAAEKPVAAQPTKAPKPVPAAQYSSEHKVDWSKEAQRESEPTTTEGGTSLEVEDAPKLGIVVDKTAASVSEETKETITLPGNTIFHGVLLTGAVVPVGNKSDENPVPVLMRVKEDAILANHFSADVKECFLSASGSGDLSSERVEFRAERLVCIREDGGVLEAPIEMWSVGEDGMAGVRGKLVHKAGALVAQATLAATLEGFSKMFSTVPVPTLSTTGTSETVFQQVMSEDALQGATVAGIGGGLERLTDYMMDLAEEILPVLEVHALREIGFVMIKGQTLEFSETIMPNGLQAGL